MGNRSQIRIRNQRLSDDKVFFRILKEGQFPYFIAAPKTLEDERLFLEQSIQKRKQREEFNFSVLLNTRVIGAVGFRPQAGPSRHVAEAGYFIARDHWGKGYAVEALALLEPKARERHIQRLELLIVPENSQSVRVAEKSGYHREGRLHSKLRLRKGLADAYLYAKLLD